MRLSRRLEEVASFVREGGVVADVGTDHGYIPIFLVKENKVPSAIAMDVRKGPLERAEEHISEYGLEDRIQVRLSDGLEKLKPGEADTVVIAGMGGELIIRIMKQGEHMWKSVGQWVLSPQSELAEVRRFLAESGFRIEKETMLYEDGKFYTIMSVYLGEKSGDYIGDAVQETYGKYLLEEKNPVLYDFLLHENQVKQQILAGVSGQTSESSKRRAEELEQELEWNRKALAFFEQE